MRLLFATDAACPTGFAKAAHSVMRHWIDDLGWKVSCLAINAPGQKQEPYDYRGAQIYPTVTAEFPGDFLGVQRLAEVFVRTRPDVLLIQNDAWNVVIMLEKLRELGETQLPVVAWMPPDSKHMRYVVAEALNALTTAVFTTEFGLNEAKASGFTGDGRVVGMGVDLEVYYPMDRRQARESLGVTGPLLDAFWVGNVNSANPRKRLDLTMRAFALFLEKYRPKRPCVLYLHCTQDRRGYDLADLAAYLGINGRVIGPPRLFDDETEMRGMYNALDVQISTTGGEGWGLTHCEGMACGVPQIAANYAAMAEWAKDAFLPVPIVDYYVTPGSVNTFQGVVSVAVMAAQIQRVYYAGKDLRRKMGEKGRKRVEQPEFRWDAVSDRLGAVLTEAAETAKRKAA